MAPKDTQKNTPLIVGQLGAPYGTQGWLKVNSFTDPKENIFQYQPWQFYIQHRWVFIPIKEVRSHSHPPIIQFENCITPEEAARQYTGAKIGIHPDQLLPLPKDEYYWSQLVGLEVITDTGISLGVVDHLMETGSNDVLVVLGERTRCIPYLFNHVILKIDLAEKKIIVDWDPEF